MHTVIGVIVGALVGVGAGYLVRHLMANHSVDSIERQAKQTLKTQSAKPRLF